MDATQAISTVKSVIFSPRICMVSYGTLFLEEYRRSWKEQRRNFELQEENRGHATIFSGEQKRTHVSECPKVD